MQTNCKDLNSTDILNFYQHHLNEDGKLCFAAIASIKDELAILFTKMDVTVEEVITAVKSLSTKLQPIVQHCPKIGIDY